MLTVCGGALTLTVGGRLEYILPAPAATQEGGELNALYEEAQKQMASIADSITAGAVGARAQGVNLSAEAQSAEATVYAVGSGYFDVTHETLLDGRLISEADVKRAENVVVIDERMALSFFAGNEPVGQTVTLSGLDYEVSGHQPKGGWSETDEHIAYIPITSASANALAMQTVEMIAKTADKTTGSAILMENTLKTWQPGGALQLRQAGARRGDADSLGSALCWGRAAAQPAGAAERGGVGAGLPLPTGSKRGTRGICSRG